MLASVHLMAEKGEGEGEELVEKVGEGTAELEKRRVDWVKQQKFLIVVMFGGLAFSLLLLLGGLSGDLGQCFPGVYKISKMWREDENRWEKVNEHGRLPISHKLKHFI
jgi:hypothetical protein